MLICFKILCIFAAFANFANSTTWTNSDCDGGKERLDEANDLIDDLNRKGMSNFVYNRANKCVNTHNSENRRSITASYSSKSEEAAALEKFCKKVHDSLDTFYQCLIGVKSFQGCVSVSNIDDYVVTTDDSSYEGDHALNCTKIFENDSENAKNCDEYESVVNTYK